MNSYEWYKVVESETSVTQGDFIDNCPVLTWDSAASGDLEKRFTAEYLDCIVMSQACDLEQAHVREVILCPNYALDVYKGYWVQYMEKRGQSPTPKAWRKFLDDVCDGKQWNLTMLNQYDGAVSSEIRMVDFHAIFSIPYDFIETWLREQSGPRLTLLPPYREHLSQAFARYFMRVGLPVNIPKTWHNS